MLEKAKIVIIDDEEDICTFSKSILEKTGKYEVFTATKPMTGINLAKLHKPDLVLLDVFMPELDGSKVAERLLNDEATKHTRIVFLTALVKDSEVVGTSGQIGGRAFIPKPVSPQELVKRVEAFLAEKAP
jgi:DNA-binding response OmpR family regulator